MEKIFSKYGRLNEIWLATYAPYYAFINYESKSDMEVGPKRNILVHIKTILYSMPAKKQMEKKLLAEG